MRHEPNNGIDLLLRQLGRREDAFPPDVEAQHLDADELSSYVANALPAKARARYMQHLADCSTCRTTVAQLSAAEGAVVTAQQPATVVGQSGFKSFLASLFSPMVLRYSVPALGVIVLTVVGIVMLRQEQRKGADKPVAQVTSTEQNTSVPESPAATTAPTSTPVRAQAKQEPRADVMADASAPAPPAGAAPPKATPDEEKQRQPEPEKKTATAAEQNAGARDAIQTFDTSARADQAVNKDKREVDEAVPATAAPVVTGSKMAEPQRTKTGAVASSGAGVASAGNTPQSRHELRRSRKEETQGNFSAAETRSVAGREFIKRGDVWIDVAYNSDQSITIVKRDTEQYRALVADEPAIHTIAENLKSEFVVVWKGRAYRVR